jgi:hypothetical protein
MIVKNISEMASLQIWDSYHIQEYIDAVAKWPEFVEEAEKIKNKYDLEIWKENILQEKIAEEKKTKKTLPPKKK